MNDEWDECMMHAFCWWDEEGCAWCGADEAPNFHHKPTGVKVWWYKYIGRGMEVVAPEGVDPVDAVTACLRLDLGGAA